MANTEIKIDYLSATFPIQELDRTYILYDVHTIVEAFAIFLNVKPGEVCQDKFGQNHFDYQYHLGNYIILRLAGPLDRSGYKTCQLELKGDGCRDFERRNPEKTWQDLLFFLAGQQASFKRIDIAIDDFEGNIINLEYLHHKVIDNDYYTSVFRHKPIPMGRKEYGMSIQFGSNQSNTELVIYDKLQERNKRKVECDKTYWVRYEMRFRNENAQTIAVDIVKALDKNNLDDEMQKFAKSQLYRILDIKEDNNYKDANQKQVPTDSKWLEFLDNVEKAEFVKFEFDKKIKNLDEYGDYIAPFLMPYLIATFISSNKSEYMTETKIWEYIQKHFKFSKHQLFRMNMLIQGFGYEMLDNKELFNIEQKIKEIIEDKQLPF